MPAIFRCIFLLLHLTDFSFLPLDVFIIHIYQYHDINLLPYVSLWKYNYIDPFIYFIVQSTETFTFI